MRILNEEEAQRVVLRWAASVTPGLRNADSPLRPTETDSAFEQDPCKRTNIWEMLD